MTKHVALQIGKHKKNSVLWGDKIDTKIIRMVQLALTNRKLQIHQNNYYLFHNIRCAPLLNSNRMHWCWRENFNQHNFWPLLSCYLVLFACENPLKTFSGWCEIELEHIMHAWKKSGASCYIMCVPVLMMLTIISICRCCDLTKSSFK